MAQSIIKQNELMFKMILIAFAIFIAAAIYFIFFTRASVSVEVVPTSAVVTLDNKPIEIKDGKAKTQTTFGKHTLLIEADNYIGFKSEINLKRGRNYSNSVTLKKSPSPIEISGGASNIAIKDNSVYYQNPNDKLFYYSTIAYTNDGSASISETKNMTSKAIDGFDKIVWSPTKELILIKSGSHVSLLDFKKYDFVNQNIVSFGDNIGDIVWSPDNSRIAYFYAPVGGEKTLIFSDATNQTIYRAANLADLGIDDPYLAFSPDSEWLIIIPRNQNYDQNQLYVMNVYTREIKLVDSTGNQKEGVFTTDSSKILYSTYDTDAANPTRRTAYVIDRSGQNKNKLNLAASAATSRYSSDPNKIYLLENRNGGKMVLVDVGSGQVTDFYFSGQKNLTINDYYPNSDFSGAVFTSSGKLYFVKLEGNQS